MGRFEDLAGQRFSKVVAIERGPNKGTATRWWCQCDCGQRTLAHAGALKKGLTKSCGCGENAVRHGHTLNGKKSKTWSAWHDLRHRCSNFKNKHFKDYGGRGISVCERWQTFENFLEDMGEAPRGMYIDRVDNDVNYEHGNCRWVTSKESAQNRRNLWITRRANLEKREQRAR